MGKYAFFVFNGNPMCFVHVMLNALDLDTRGNDVKIILEGEAVALNREMREKGNKLFAMLEEKFILDSACRACSKANGVLEYNEKSGIRISDEMNGHPAMSTYIDMGYTIITI